MHKPKTISPGSVSIEGSESKRFPPAPTLIRMAKEGPDHFPNQWYWQEKFKSFSSSSRSISQSLQISGEHFQKTLFKLRNNSLGSKIPIRLEPQTHWCAEAEVYIPRGVSYLDSTSIFQLPWLSFLSPL